MASANGDPKGTVDETLVLEHQQMDVLLKLVEGNKLSELKKLLTDNKSIKCVDNLRDSEGMTLLQHACYRGNLEIAKTLVEMGADVNFTKHKHSYSALHFATLSGKVDLCLFLMSAGAKTGVRNSVGCTPTQLGAFVASYPCVVSINNYVPKSDVEYFAVPRGLNTKPKLYPNLVDPLYEYIMQVNLHPVRLALKMPKRVLEEYKQCKETLELMRDREVRKAGDRSEALAMKFHYLGWILTEYHKFENPDKKSYSIELYVKKMLKVANGQEYMDYLVRECLREFPYRDLPLFQNVARSLTARETERAPAHEVLSVAINGRNVSEGEWCMTCANTGALRRCTKCRRAAYCDRECQRLHWFAHKKVCRADDQGA